MVQKPDDTDETVPLAKVSLLIREKKVAEATQLLQVESNPFFDEEKNVLFRIICKMTNNAAVRSTAG